MSLRGVVGAYPLLIVLESEASALGGRVFAPDMWVRVLLVVVCVVPAGLVELREERRASEARRAVAAGVVTWAGNRTGYGNLVEINHGDGYVTRYAHNQRTLVAVGQTVKRGDPIALMGSTGRSTGPHVHFEVIRNGRQVNPLTFVGQQAAVARK